MSKDKAKKMYIDSNRKMSLKDIASQLGVSDGTVRSWKNRYKWDEPEDVAMKAKKKNATLQEKKRNATNATQRNDHKKGKIEQAFEIEIENNELTDKQKLFCLHYVKYWNATKAYQKAYGCDYNTANSHGYRLLSNVVVKEEINRLKKNIREGIEIEVMAAFQKYIDIAFSDITDYLRFGQREVQVIGQFGPIFTGKGENKKPVMQTVNYVDFAESSEVDGTIISEVKQGKDGISIKIADKMKALEFLTKYYDLLPDKHKRRIDEEKLKLDKERLELDKAKAAGKDGGDDDLVDDWAEAVMDDGSDEREEEEA